MNLLDATAHPSTARTSASPTRSASRTSSAWPTRLGITANLPEYPSIVIGSIAVHPIEMAAAYAAVADNGVYHTPSFIDHIVDRSGATIYMGQDPGHAVMSPQVAEEATVALQGGRPVRHRHRGRPLQPALGRARPARPTHNRRLVQRVHAAAGDARCGWATRARSPMIDVGGVGQVYGGTSRPTPGTTS